MLLKNIFLFIKIAITLIPSLTKALCTDDRIDFLDDLLTYQNRPSIVVSHFNLSKHENVVFYKRLLDKKRSLLSNKELTVDLKFQENAVHLVEFKHKNTFRLLAKAFNTKFVDATSRWLLFLETNNTKHNECEHEKIQVEELLNTVYVAVHTEIYIVMEAIDFAHLYSVYKIKPHLPFIWEDYAVWSKDDGIFRRNTEVLAIRRKNIQGANVVIPTVIPANRTLADMPDFLHREVDTATKIMYYMSLHLIEWVNGTEVRNITDSWGYKQPDGRYNGVVRELEDNRADFSGSIMIPRAYRLFAVTYVLPPGPVEAKFMFKKPALASVTNIYALPFSAGVWLSLLFLVFISTLALFLTYFREERINDRYKMSSKQKLSEGFHETLCLVFQQGTAYDPVSVANRQILLLGLLAFMFLYTAYSANVVALLQSATNEINSVETLLVSPLECGTQDIEYNRNIFKHETRPVHRAFADRKILPQGENAYLPVQEGIRRVREGMYAFQVELTAGYDEIQRTFLEDEKCNLGAIKYMSFTYPYLAVGKFSHIKEQLRIGAIRLIEGGVQDRSTRRMIPKPPNCGAGAAMFTAVRLLDVAPAFQCLSGFYALTLPILGLEIYTRKRDMKKLKKNSVRQVTTNEHNLDDV